MKISPREIQKNSPFKIKCTKKILKIWKYSTRRLHTPVILTSWPWEARLRSESGKERSKNKTAAFLVKFSEFQSKNPATKTERKRMIMKKRALCTTTSMKMETPSPAKKSKARMYSTTGGMGLQQSRKWWWFWVLEMAAAFERLFISISSLFSILTFLCFNVALFLGCEWNERGKKYRAAALFHAFCAGKKNYTVSIILVIKLRLLLKLASIPLIKVLSCYEDHQNKFIYLFIFLRKWVLK